MAIKSYTSSGIKRASFKRLREDFDSFQSMARDINNPEMSDALTMAQNSLRYMALIIAELDRRCCSGPTVQYMSRARSMHRKFVSEYDTTLGIVNAAIDAAESTVIQSASTGVKPAPVPNDLDSLIRIEDALEAIAGILYTRESYIQCNKLEYHNAYAIAWDTGLALIRQFGSNQKARNEIKRRIDAFREKPAYPKFVNTTWELRTYDVWGNSRDGYEVNDSWRIGEIDLKLTVEINHPGTPHEFLSASPTDAQIRKAFGIGRTRINTDGDDLSIYVNRKRDSYPIGEMYCVSHESLSPIRVKS